MVIDKIAFCRGLFRLLKLMGLFREMRGLLRGMRYIFKRIIGIYLKKLGVI